MDELSRRPASCPGGLEESVVCEIIRLKNAHRSWGPRKIRALYERARGGKVPSESSFKRVLQRAGLVEPRRRRRRSEVGRLYTGRKANAPNEIWTVDFKGWWYDWQNRRCEPLTVRDEFSRYVLELRAVADARSETVRACFERLFEANGMPGAIRSDNGPPFASSQAILGLSRLSAWWLVLGIDLERGRKGCPQDNGAHERLHLDIERELRGQQWQERQAALEQWRQIFNHERPHEALGMRCPAEVYRASERKYEGTPEELSYSSMAVRKVYGRGCISWREHRVMLSTALAGWSVGLEPAQEHKYNVWFGRLLLGQLDETTGSFAPTTGEEVE
jgi:transposase InsO family protein